MIGAAADAVAALLYALVQALVAESYHFPLLRSISLGTLRLNWELLTSS